MLFIKSIKKRMIEQLISQVKDKEDQWYSNKFMYALPDWFTLESEAEFVALLPIHGQDGVEIMRQRVGFEVDFYNVNSIVRYSNFLENQMCKELPVLGYVLFYNKNIVGKKDPNFKSELTPFQEEKIKLHYEQRIKVDISCAYFDSELNRLDSLDFLK